MVGRFSICRSNFRGQNINTPSNSRMLLVSKCTFGICLKFIKLPASKQPLQLDKDRVYFMKFSLVTVGSVLVSGKPNGSALYLSLS